MEQLEAILQLSHDPMIVLENNIIVQMNPIAKTQLPGFEIGRSAVGLIPDYILFNRSEQFTATMMLRARELTVSCVRTGTQLVLSLVPLRSRSSSLLSEGLLNGMRAALFNVGVSSRQMALDDTLSGKTRDYLTMLRRNYFVLDRQLSNLNFAISMSENTLVLHPVQTDLVPICRELADAVSGLTGPKLPKIEFSTALPALVSCVDPQKVEIMLLNLLSNSFQHCDADRHIQLSLTKQGEDAVICVSDNGSGIPQEIMQNVFTRFEKRLTGENLDQAYSGGLGLGIARGIAQLHGGAILIDSEPGRGTSVRVLLPLQQPELLRDPGVLWPENRIFLLLRELSDVLDYHVFREEFKP